MEFVAAQEASSRGVKLGVLNTNNMQTLSALKEVLAGKPHYVSEMAMRKGYKPVNMGCEMERMFLSLEN